MSQIRDRRKSIKYNVEWIPNMEAKSCTICDKVVNLRLSTHSQLSFAILSPNAGPTISVPAMVNHEKATPLPDVWLVGVFIVQVRRLIPRSEH